MNRFRFFSGIASGLVAISIALACATARADDAEYRVQWLHPRKVGEQQRVREVVDQTIDTSAKRSSGEQKKTSKRRIEFSGLFSIQAVDELGAPTKVRVTIDRATAHVDLAAPQELAKTGTVVVADLKAGKAQIIIDQTIKLPTDGQDLLATAIAYPFDNEMNLEETLGVVEPQRVGTSWPVSAAAIVKRISAEFDPKLEARDVKGTAKLAKITKAGDKELLEIEYQYKAESDRPFAAPGVANDFTPGPSLQETSGSAQLPADRATGPIVAHVKIRTERKFKTKPAVGEKDKSSIDNLIRLTNIVDLRIEYVTPGGAGKKPAGEK